MKRFILTAMMLVAITAQGQYVIDLSLIHI